VAARKGFALRENMPVLLAGVAAMVMMVTSVNVVSLWQSHEKVAALNAQIATLRHQEAVVQKQATWLSSRQALLELAREQYQLVSGKAQLVQILPPATNRSYGGDPANDPLISPAEAAGVAAPSTPHHDSFWSRVRRSLEFWR